MKRFCVFSILLLSLVACATAQDALTVSPGGGYISKIVWDWTSSAGGTASGRTSETIPGILYACATSPSTSGREPSNLYDVTIKRCFDSQGGISVTVLPTDIATGYLADRSDTTTELYTFWPNSLCVAAGYLQLEVSNAGPSKQGRIELYVYRTAYITRYGGGVPLGGTIGELVQWESNGAVKWITLSGEASIADGGAFTITSAQIARLNEAETITGNWVNTTNPWADNEVSDTLTASVFKGTGSATDAVDLATSEIAGTLADANVSDTLTASIFKGSGSSTNAVDLATAEVAGTLAASSVGNGLTDAQVANDLTIDSTKDIKTTLDYYVADNHVIKFGTDTDILVGYDETTDDRLEWTAGGDLLMGLRPSGSLDLMGPLYLHDNAYIPDGKAWVFGTTQDLYMYYDEITDNRLEINDGGYLLLALTDAGTTGNLLATGTLTLGSGSTVVSDATGLLLGSALDIVGTTLELGVADEDGLLIHDYSAGVNRKTTILSLHHIWETIELTPGGAVLPASNPAEYSLWATTTNANLVPTLRFDTTTAETAQWGNVILPNDYQAGSTLRVYALWTIRTGGGAGQTINLEVSGVARGNDNVIDAAFGDAVELNDTWIANGDVHTTAVGTLTLAGMPLPLDMVTIKLKRDVANDDLAGDCDVLGIYLQYQTKKEVVE